jgi:hypothetical protein
VRPVCGPRWVRSENCYDNALCEGFFATLECELIDRTCLHTHSLARMKIFDYIEGWYLFRIRNKE